MVEQLKKYGANHQALESYRKKIVVLAREYDESKSLADNLMKPLTKKLRSGYALAKGNTSTLAAIKSSFAK